MRRPIPLTCLLFFTLLAFSFGVAAETMAIDGFSDPNSELRVWWGGMTYLGNHQWSTVGLHPMEEEGAQFIRTCTPQFNEEEHFLMILVSDESLDATGYEGVQVVLRASEPCRVELGITWYDASLTGVCNEDYPDYAKPSHIAVFEAFEIHRIPFSLYRVEEYTANVCPSVSSTLGTHALKEFKFYILNPGVCVDILEVSLYKTAE